MRTSNSKILVPSPSSMERNDFLERFGGIYENTTWIAEDLWRRGLNQTHDEVEVFAAAMASVLASSDDEKKLALLRAHPDLAGKAAIAGEMTDHSIGEQASAGLDQCTPAELENFQALNDAYWAKFDFPFILAVRGRNRHEILANFETRLANDRAEEFEEALRQVNDIARLRLDAIAE